MIDRKTRVTIIGISIKLVFGVCAFLGILTTIGIIFVLGNEGFQFFRQVPIWDFLTGTEWTPLLEPKSFGVLPLVVGTLQVTIGAGIIAMPLGLLCAVYLSVYAGKKRRNTLKPILEVLSGIPTIVYGFFALTFITPILQKIIPNTEIFNAASGAIVVAIMILPMIASLCDDAFRAIPRSVKDGAFAIGATTNEVVMGIMIPYSLSRILAAFILALSRAIGETMAVTLASGSNPQLTLSPLKSIQTMTAYIVQVSLGDTQAGGIEYLTCFAVGLLLFVMTFMMNLLGQIILTKFRVKSL